MSSTIIAFATKQCGAGVERNEPESLASWCGPAQKCDQENGFDFVGNRQEGNRKVWDAKTQSQFRVSQNLAVQLLVIFLRLREVLHFDSIPSHLECSSLTRIASDETTRMNKYASFNTAFGAQLIIPYASPGFRESLS